MSPSQGLCLHTGQYKQRIKAQNTDIHALSWIRTHDPSVRASEDSLCLRQRGYCDRLFVLLMGLFATVNIFEQIKSKFAK
jgi:hypothetical protein